MSNKFIHKLFASPVFQFKVKDHEKLNANLSKYIYGLYENDKEGVQRSNVNGWHSKNFKVEKGNSWHFRKSFNQWKDVELILHQGAISDTTCTNLNAIHTFNVDFTEWLFKEAIKYQIPIKYASSASVYGNTSDIINPLNYYAISKVMMDYWVQDHIDEFKLVQGFRYFNVYGLSLIHI